MKGKRAEPGVGSKQENTKAIDTEKHPNKSVGCGLPDSYFGNSRDIDTDHHSND